MSPIAAKVAGTRAGWLGHTSSPFKHPVLSTCLCQWICKEQILTQKVNTWPFDTQEESVRALQVEPNLLPSWHTMDEDCLVAGSQGQTAEISQAKARKGDLHLFYFLSVII